MKERRVKDSLADLDVRPSKRRGQNFLIDEGVLMDIASFGRPRPGEKLVEIGPGLGALTKHLARASQDLTVIEIEPKFCEELRGKFPGITIVNADVREVNLSSLGASLVVYGNLPYSHSTEILFHVLDNRGSINRAIFLLQKEFCERVASEPGGREYGTISVMTQALAKVSTGSVVPGDRFHPPANVDSMILGLDFSAPPAARGDDLERLRRTVRASFLKRRKKISNSLRASGFYSKEQIDAAFQESGLDPGRRAETLSLEEFLLLARSLAEHASRSQ